MMSAEKTMTGAATLFVKLAARAARTLKGPLAPSFLQPY
jgi:hypothetical protein